MARRRSVLPQQLEASRREARRELREEQLPLSQQPRREERQQVILVILTNININCNPLYLS